jgi:site-specific recombinase XerD
VSRFASWCKDEAIQTEKASYTDLLNYIQYCQGMNNGKSTINQKITILKHYYHFLIACKKRTDNPALEMRIRNQIKKVPYHLLSSEELKNIYKQYPASGIAGKRNKAMLGLMIYQGVSTGELGQIELNDLKLEEGKIYIPAVGRSNSRTLQLESSQVLQLQNYILTIRPVLIAMTEKQTDKLFMSLGKGDGLSNSFTKMMRIIKKLNPKAKDAKQIRASIITEWLKVYNIRQVQYMIGHRYVSSTEHYRTDKLGTLQEQLESLHPLG